MRVKSNASLTSELFVEILPGKEGLCHISKLDSKRVNAVRDVISEGEIIRVKVLGVDRQGKWIFSRKDAMQQEHHPDK